MKLRFRTLQRKRCHTLQFSSVVTTPVGVLKIGRRGNGRPDKNCTQTAGRPAYGETEQINKIYYGACRLYVTGMT